MSLTIPDGRLVSLIGPSGCGKSTLFSIIAGLLRPTTGDVLADGESIVGRPGHVAYMLQKSLLLPWRTIIDNIILAAEVRGVPKRESIARAQPLIEHYGLGGFEQHYPHELSGGMRQRASLLRTMLYDRDVVLLDEPFGALDAQTRLLMQSWLLQVWSDLGKTILFVTHDIDEAIYLSDEIYVFTARPGRIKAHIKIASVAAARPGHRHEHAVHGAEATASRLAQRRGPHRRTAGVIAMSDPDITAVDDDEVAERRTRRCAAIWRWALGVGIILGWEILTRLKIIDPYYFSSPTSDREHRLRGGNARNALCRYRLHVGIDDRRLHHRCRQAGALLGLSTWWSRVYGRVSEPYLVTFNAIPKLALAPILIILFGIGFESKVALAVALTIVPAALAAYGGVKSVDKDLETLLFSLGATRFQVFAKVVVPWAMPWIVSSLRVNIGLALAGAIVGEFIASRFGIGRMILYAGQVMDINLVWVGVVVLSILALVMYTAVMTAERYLLKGMLHGSQLSTQ